MPPQLVIFDCDGVLVDSELLNHQARAGVLANYGVSLTIPEAIAHFKGVSNPDTAAKITALWGLALPPDFVQQIEQAEWELLETRLQPVAGVRDVVEAVAAAGVGLCVASNGAPDAIDQRLRVTGLLPYFDGRLYSASHVPHGKPFPDLFLHAAADMGVPPSECVVIEDSLPGVQAAAAAGMPVLAYAPNDAPGPLQTAGAHVFTAMADLPNLLGLELRHGA